jgi:hypothetical protein
LNYRKLILPVAVYGVRNLVSHLIKEHKLKVYKKEVPSSIFGCVLHVTVLCIKPTAVGYKFSYISDHLIKDGKGKHILWLQKILVEACHVKLSFEKHSIPNKIPSMEPVPHHYTRKQLPIYVPF